MCIITWPREFLEFRLFPVRGPGVHTLLPISPTFPSYVARAIAGHRNVLSCVLCTLRVRFVYLFAKYRCGALQLSRTYTILGRSRLKAYYHGEVDARFRWFTAFQSELLEACDTPNHRLAFLRFFPPSRAFSCQRFAPLYREVFPAFVRFAFSCRFLLFIASPSVRRLRTL